MKCEGHKRRQSHTHYEDSCDGRVYRLKVKVELVGFTGQRGKVVMVGFTDQRGKVVLVWATHLFR